MSSMKVAEVRSRVARNVPIVAVTFIDCTPDLQPKLYQLTEHIHDLAIDMHVIQFRIWIYLLQLNICPVRYVGTDVTESRINGVNKSRR